MKRIFIMSIGVLFVFAAVTAAQTPPSPTPQPPAVGKNFVDANGDGICDRFAAGTPGQGQGAQKGRRTGPQDGTGQKLRKGGGQGGGAGLGPASGAGRGTGICDGTGPKGRRGGR